jgi:copper transport protein
VFDLDAWSSALDTRVGMAWFIRALLIGFGGALLVLTIARRHDFWWRALFAAALLGVGVASAFSGHGATGRWHAVGIIATVVHVAAMAAWLGGVMMVLVGVRKLTVGQLRLFSTVAVSAMLLIVASGVVQAIRQVESLDALTNTNYGTLLLWKVGFVVAVLIVAAISRRIVWRQQLDRPRLIRTVAIEVVLAVAVVSVTAVLMGANPSQAVQSGPFSAQLVNQGYIASITIEPARVGSNVMHLYLSNPQSSLVEPDDVQVQISDPSREVAPLDVTMVRSGASHYSSTDLVFPYSATWVLTVNTRYNTFDSVQFTTNVPIP